LPVSSIRAAVPVSALAVVSAALIRLDQSPRSI
jgi:hypothetical protein